jgi:tRNA1(Val) A37 N6-methylase TrmN6
MSASDGADLLLGGRLHLHQAKAGHRAGTDAILLAAAVPRAASGLLIDAGSSSGAAGLAAALDRPGLRLLLIDREPDAIVLASRNMIANGLESRGAACVADLLVAKSRRDAGLVDGTGDVVVSNPPYLDPGQGRRSPDESRARAHVFDAEGGLDRWVRACTALCAPQGEIFFIHRADRLADLLAQLAPKAGSFRIRPVQPFGDEPAKRVIVRAVKTGKAPLVLLTALVLHDREGGKHTTAAEAILRGQAALD